MKTSLFATLALALVLAGCNKATRSNSDDTAAANDAASTSTSSTFASTHADTSATNTASNDLRNATNSAANALGNAATNVATTARMAEWKLNPSDIQADLNDNRDIVRTKDANASTPTGNADKSVIESMVKGRLEADSELAALKLKVSADRHGAVKLSGKADSAEEVGRAIALSLDTEGVTKVTSKVKLDKDAKTNR